MMAEPAMDMRKHEERLATFYKQEHPTKKARTAAAKGIPQSWPHETPTAEDLAAAGFIYMPTSTSPDNVKCFHCGVKLDGWEIDDDPIREHIAHNTTCEWAIVISTQLPNEDRDPMSETLLDARMSTFTGVWPHDKKRSWKPKSTKMAEAGWCCDMSTEDDDAATCFYCKASLSGWVAKDDPIAEHRRKTPDCLFFDLVDRYASSRPKKTRGRNSTSSKASRLSTQSIQSTFSEVPSFMSLGENAPTLDGETSIGTITSTASTAKGKKKAAPKKTGRMKKKNADDTTEIEAALSNMPEDNVALTQLTSQEVPDTQMDDIKEDSTIDVKQEKAKKPARGKAKGKKTAASKQPVEEVQRSADLEQEQIVHAEEPEPTKPTTRAKRGKKRTSDGEEKVDEDESAQTVAVESVETPSQEEPAQPAKPKKGRAAKGTKGKTGDDDQAAGTRSILADAMGVEEAPMDAGQEVPKTKKGGRKLKATKAVKEPTPEPVVEAEPEVEPSVDDESANYVVNPGEEDSEANYVVHDESSANFIVHAQTPPPADLEPTPTPQKAASPKPASRPIEHHTQSSPASVHSNGSAQSSDAENQNPSFSKESRRITSTGLGSTTILPPAPSPPPANTTVDLPALQLSPTKTTRVPLAAQTPNRSPSKLSPTKLGHLKSSHPWTATDIETIFFATEDTGKENATRGDVAGKMAALGAELSSPEKKMTVEQWIYHQARKGEEKLRDECERLVWLFEQEGVRALRTLEGVKVRGERWDESILA